MKEIKHSIEYYDKKQGLYGRFYVIASTYNEAIALFRQMYSKMDYDIIEVAKVYDKDWSKL